MNFKNKVYSIGFLSILSLISVKSVFAISLIDSVNKTIESNYDYKKSIEDYNAAYTQKNIAMSYLLPRLDLSANFMPSKNTTETDVTDFSYNSKDTSLSLVLYQPILQMDAIRQFGKSKIIQTQAKTKLDLSRNTILLNVVNAYLDTMFARDSLDAITEKRKFFEERLRTVEVDFKVGNSNKVDLQETQANYEESVAQEVSARNDFDVAKDFLAKIINENVDDVQVMKSVFSDIEMPQSVDEIKDISLKANLEIIVATLQLDLANKDVQIANSDYYPDIGLVAGGQISSGTGINSTTGATTDSSLTNTYVGVQAKMNLFAGGGTYSEAKRLGAVKNGTNYSLSSKINEVSKLVNKYYFDIYTGKSKMKSLEMAYAARKEYLASVQKEVAVGVKTNSDLLEANNKLLDVKLSLIGLRYQLLKAYLMLKNLSGNLELKDIEYLATFIE
jgi:TolC family type I secretion outer membrane protein